MRLNISKCSVISYTRKRTPIVLNDNSFVMVRVRDGKRWFLLKARLTRGEWWIRPPSTLPLHFQPRKWIVYAPPTSTASKSYHARRLSFGCSFWELNYSPLPRLGTIFDVFSGKSEKLRRKLGIGESTKKENEGREEINQLYKWAPSCLMHKARGAWNEILLRHQLDRKGPCGTSLQLTSGSDPKRQPILPIPPEGGLIESAFGLVFFYSPISSLSCSF